MSAPGSVGPAGRAKGEGVIKEPQGVADLMAHTEAAWQREVDDCDDATAEARAALVADLVALRAEYGDAAYPRKAAIEKELRALIRRHDALGADTAEPEAETGEAAPPGPVPLAPESAARADRWEHAETPPHPHGPVPLGPESSVRPRGGDAPMGTAHEPHGPVPLGPESAVRSAGGHRPAPPTPPRPRPGANAPGPIPHGAPAPPGPGAGFAPRPGEDPTHGHSDDDSGGAPWTDPAGGWSPRARGRIGRWVAWGRLAIRYEVLLRKREARLSEVGVRIRQLEEKGAAATAGSDAGVRARLAQVAQVDAEIAKVKAQREALGGP